MGRGAGEVHLRQGGLPVLAAPQGRPHPLSTTRSHDLVHDAAVVGAGVFGSWTAWHLQRAGKTVALVDAYGPASSRASSGGETRILRMGYGRDELYTRWAWSSLEQWKALAARAGSATLFQETGVLWMAHEQDPRSHATLETLAQVGIPHDRLDRAQLEARWPQVDFGEVTWGIHEPRGGALMARRSVQALAAEVARGGGDVHLAAARPPAGEGGLSEVRLADGGRVRARSFVFALGPWLGKVFPDLLGDRIFPTRQEVFYFGPPAGDTRFAPPAFPAWIDFVDEIYGIPDLEARGFKVAPDAHGPRFDPDTGERRVTEEGLATARAFLARRFPLLKDAPLVASEVCQYENTSNGDFLIDRHPSWENVWLVG
ncbi:MAG TPA: FAD-dependent oxidoreductase, partial [Vicinamibacteria bacterium]|nr:FAD-dependent oxidoreductase [Vicinamibacteria bacterium]